MSIAFSGSVPPNPTELLDSDRLGTLIGWMKEHFDYVIIDSAPMLPVSDSVLINRYVDNTLYIIRSEYTGLKVLPDIKLLFEQSHIKSPKFILNCVDLSSKVFKYGYGSGYGYGYGYGYGGYGYGHGYCYGYGYSYESSDSRKKRHRYHLHRHRNDSEKGQTASQA